MSEDVLLNEYTRNHTGDQQKKKKKNLKVINKHVIFKLLKEILTGC